MPSPDHAETQPVVQPSASREGPSPDCAAAGLQDALQRLASQIGDADRRHGDALKDMQERLGQFGRQVDQVRSGLPEQYAGGLSRIEQEIAALAERIAAFGRERQSHKGLSGGTSRGLSGGTSPGMGGPAQPESAAAADEPWDARSAEALTRVYEMAEAELASDRRQKRTPKSGKQESGKQEAGKQESGKPARPVPAAAARPQPPAYDQAWLEAGFAGIAALLQQSLAHSNPAKSLAALDRRLDQLEERLDTLLSNISARLGGELLAPIEEHIKELVKHFEATSRQLSRLDAIDEQLRQLSRALEEQRERPQMQPAGLRDTDVEALIDTAAERAASRLAAATTAPAAEEAKRIDALEGLMQDYIAERRRGEESTSSMLHTIEDALIRIIDRVEAMEAAGPAAHPRPDDDAAGQDQDGMEAEDERLAQAYAAGARILGQKPAEPMLSAADYAPLALGEEPGTAAPAAHGTSEDTAVEDTQTRQELRASAMRAKLKAQTAPDQPTPASPAADDTMADSARRARDKTSAWGGGRRSSLLLGGAMALLFGAGYLTVDLFVVPTSAPAAQQNSAAPNAEGRPTTADLAQPGPQDGTAGPQPGPQTGPLTGRSDVAPAADDKNAVPVPKPQPAQRRTRETAVDDPSQGQAEAEATRHLIGLQPPATPPAPAAEPAALSPQALPGMIVEPGLLTTNDGPALPGGSAVPPASIGSAALRAAAAKGDASAQFEVATRFAEGNGVPQDHKQAVAWYERAAMRGLASAQFRLGAYYERGLGVAADPERAKIWYRRAAEQGHVRAMHNLAVLIVGKGNEPADYTAAVHWFRQAAERGFTDSQFNLALLYAHGRGVGKDLTESYKWFALAARSGDAGAARRLEEIKSQLEVTERDAAEQKLAAWRAEPAEAASR